MKNLYCALNLFTDKAPNFPIYLYYFAFEKIVQF